MTKSSPPAPVALEPDFVAELKKLFEEKVVFNQHIGLTFDHISPQKVCGQLQMRPELVGHFSHGRLHGGVISAAIDAAGGLAVMAALSARHLDESYEQRLQRFVKVGTIDLRVDYLRPGLGERFEVHATVLRLGSRVASTRMEFLRTDGTLLCTGSGTYIVS